MKRYLSILLAAVMLCSCLPALAEGGTHSVSFDRSEAELHVGDELTLTLTQTGGSVEPQYSVSDGTLLEITSGSSGCTVKCLAVGNGTATVTATAGTATATCTLTLTNFERRYNSDNVKDAGITIVAQGKNVTLVLNGTNTLTGLAAREVQAGILYGANSLTLKGDGSLNCVDSAGALGVNAGVIQLEDCELLDGKIFTTLTAPVLTSRSHTTMTIPIRPPPPPSPSAKSAMP